MEKLETMIRELPPELQQEVEDFIRFLLEKHGRKSKRRLRLEWRGAMEHLRDRYTSVELQHKTREWWED